MSSKFKFFGVVVMAMLAVGIFVSTAQADVTGTFGTHFALIPQTTVSEIALIDFDIQNELNVTAVISGLSTTFHTHFGIAGVEDVILTTNATLGALDIQTLLVFGRFSFGSIDPFYTSLHFIKKAVTASIQLGGVSFTNVAVVEDANAFGVIAGQVVPSGTLAPQSAIYAFGDVISLSGQTPSGVSISASAGFCMTRVPNSIKKHFAILPYSINPDCVDEPKPDILFDFETVNISGVPVAPNVTGSANITCVTINACVLTTTFSFAGGPFPFSATLVFTDLLSLDFAGATIAFTSGPGVLTLEVQPDGTLGVVGVSIVTVLNPDTNPASLVLAAEIVPGVGLTDAIVQLSIQRAGLTFGMTAVFAGGPPAQFAGVTFSLDVPGPLLSIEADTTFTAAGLSRADIWLTVAF